MSTENCLKEDELTVVEVLQRWRAQDTQNEGELVVIVTTGEKRFAAEHFSQNAADGPDIDSLSVLLEGHCNQNSHKSGSLSSHQDEGLARTHDFRCAVPSGGDVFSHEACSLLVIDKG